MAERSGIGACTQPLLSGSRREQALRAVDVLADSIAERVAAEADASLGRGQAGLAVFFAELARARNDSLTVALAEQCLDRAVAAMSRQAMSPLLLTGFSGVAWAVAVVDELLDPDGDDRVGAIDEVLAQFLARPRPWPGAHDLVRGVTGIGIYAMGRYPRPLAAQCLRHVVVRLRESARHDDAGAYWWTPPEVLGPDIAERYPSGLADLGVAHGQPGAIALLSEITSTGVDGTAGTLLDEAVSWLLAQAITTEDGPTFPAFVTSGIEPGPARSAWCYGDPGVAATLLGAARCTHRSDWEQVATALAHRAADRPPAEAGVVDACLCHGAAGLAHLFDRVWHVTGDPRVREAGVYWVDVTLRFCSAAAQLGEEWVFGTADPRQGPWTGLGVLEGAAGLGLALLSAATAEVPAWDGMLLLAGLAPRDSQVLGACDGPA